MVHAYFDPKSIFLPQYKCAIKARELNNRLVLGFDLN